MSPAEYEGTAQKLDEAITASDWPELKPLVHDEAKASEFPFFALSPVLGDAAQAIAQDVQAPGALAGGSVLAAASLATSPLANVLLPHGQRAPLSLFVITAASSGDRKSATDQVACHAIEEVRKQEARAYSRALTCWKEENSGRSKGEKVGPPAPKVLTTSNPTVEGITKLLKSQSSVGVFSAEGGEVLGGHSLRDERRMSSLSFYLKGWGAEPLDSLRGGEGLTVLLDRRMTWHILVQPVIMSQLLADPIAQGQGLLARCLISQPESLAGTRLFRQCKPLENSATVRFNNRIRELLAQQPKLRDEGDGYELNPPDLPMTQSASAMWVNYYNQVEQGQRPDGELADARPFASKAAEHAARIAAVIAIIEGETIIHDEHMLGGINLAAFYMAEHLRLTGVGRDEKRIGQLQTLFDWMCGTGRFVTTTDVLQKAPRPLRRLKAAGVKDLLTDLEMRGYIRKTSTPGEYEVRDVQR